MCRTYFFISFKDRFNEDKQCIIDYSHALLLTALDDSAAWYILGLHDFIQGDRIKIERYSKHLDEKLKIYDLFDKLVEKEPKYSGKPFGSRWHKLPTTE